MKEGLNVLSLFDGISCGQLALKKAGIKVKNYYASEIEKNAIAVTQKNFHNTVQLGDVKEVKGKELPKIDVLIGGSPCQGFSTAGKKLNFEDPRSKLFFEFLRLKKETNPKYFFFENVRMNKTVEEKISSLLGVEPIKVNSDLVSAQNRYRLYWTNIPGIKIPKDRGVMFAGILETKGTSCSINSFKHKGEKIKFINQQGSHYKTNLITNIYSNKTKPQNGRLFSTCNSKSPYAAKTCDSIKILDRGKIRKLTPVEYERLQTIPDNYTAGHSNCARYKMVGNAWTVDMISHFFKNIKKQPIKKVALNAPIPKKNNTLLYIGISAAVLGIIALSSNKATAKPTSEPDNPTPSNNTDWMNAIGNTFGSLDATQVNSIIQIENAWQQWGDGDNNKLAYIFATAWHESKLRPVQERRANIGTSLRERQDRYWSTGYYGRGYVQLTWQSNYIKMGNFLNVDLVNNPDLALDPFYAAQIVVYGMTRGSFTGIKLNQYINNFNLDYFHARRVVNGTDKAALIAEYTNSLIDNLNLIS